MWGTEMGFKKMKKQFGYVFTAALALVAVSANAAPTLEIAEGSGSTLTQGPTTSVQENMYLFNPDNPNGITFSTAYFPKVNVSYTIVNQQYNSSLADNRKGIVFGATTGTGNTTAKAYIFQKMSSVGQAVSSDFTASRNDTAGTGINADLNFGTWLRLQTDPLLVAGKSIYTKGENNGLGYYFGDVVVKFDRAVKNPVINISGLGGTLGSIGVTVNLKLKSYPAGTVISKLSGRGLTVNSSNFEIKNGNSSFGASTGDGAGKGASGSIQIYNDKEINEPLVFGLYLASDASSGSTSAWTTTGGDAFSFSAASIDSMVGDLLLEKTNKVTQVPKGSNTKYTVRVTNKGPDTFTGTFLNDSLAQGLEFVKVECSTAENNKCTDSSKIIKEKLFVTDADLTSASNTGQDTGALAKDQFYEVEVTAIVIGEVGTKTINKASVKLPTLGSSTGVACKNQAGVGGTTGLTRVFNETSGICSVTDTDTIGKPVADLAVLKTAEKTEYKAGDLVKYTIQAWNEGPSDIAEVVVTDNVPVSLASVQMYTCKEYGAAKCPTMSLNTGSGTTKNLITSPKFTLPVTGKDSNQNKIDYLEFTLTALAYQTGSVTNTAEIASALAETETNTANNKSSVMVNVLKDAPVTTGDAKNMCKGAQSVNLIKDIDTKFYSNGANHVLTSQPYNLDSVVPFSVAYGTGPNGALQLQGKINWSYGDPRITGSTIKIYANGTPYAVLTTPGASSNNDATFTALNGATVSPGSFEKQSYKTEPAVINFTVTLPTTVVSNLSTLRVDFENISPNKNANDAGDDIGFSLNNLNACLKPTFELKKISEGGTDAFEFENFSNLAANASYQIQSGEVVTTVVGSAQNVRLKNSVSPVENGVTAPVYADANKAISFTEKTSDLYSLRSVECTDSNAGVSENGIGNLAVFQGSTVTLDASKVKFASKLICKVTNEKKAGYVFSGRVINDNSGTTQDAAKAYNGVADSGEVGIAGSRIELQNCSTKNVIASAQTNANGDFEIRTLQNVFDATSNNVCLVQKNVDGYTSVSSTKSTVANETYDLFTVEKNGTARVYDGFIFGDAQLQLILTQNGQKNISAGDVVDYPHEIISNSVHYLGELTPSNVQQPSGQNWQSMIYHDTNCNGLVDVNEKLYSAALQNTPVMPGQKICLVQRVVSSAAAKAGDSLTAEFKLDYSQDDKGNTAKQSNAVHDITTVGSAGLDIKKQVRTVNACPSTSADTALFATENTAKKEQFLEYQIAYTNSSAKKLIDVVLKDSVPLGTEYKTCTENCTQTGSSLEWTVPGTLLPGARGNVLFCVKVQ